MGFPSLFWRSLGTVCVKRFNGLFQWNQRSERELRPRQENDKRTGYIGGKAHQI